MHVEKIFSSILVLESFPNIDNQVLKDYAYKCQKDDPEGIVKSNHLGWQSDRLTIPCPTVGNLHDVILDTLEPLKADLKIKKNAEFYLSNLWLNINCSKSINMPHIHPDAFFAGVYYVTAPEDSGDLVLKNPAVGQQYHVDEKLLEDFSSLAMTFSISPKDNLCVIFPGWIEHFVKPNTSSKDRISIAFNVGIR